MREIEVHVHGVYTIEIEDDADIQDEVEQSFIEMFYYDPDFEIERYEDVD